jgi:RNA polymerase sigma factor (sigma-70 family)
MICDEPALMADLQAGRPVWGEVYACCRTRMWKAARRALGGHSVRGQDADDALSEAIAEAMRPGKRLPTKSLCGWLATIAALRAIDIVRPSRREVPIDEEDAQRDRVDFEGQAVDAVLVEQALDVLEGLPVERHVIEQRIMLERPAKDVAPEAGCSPQNLPNVIARALMAIRDDPAFIDDPPIDQDVDLKAPGRTSGEDR